MHAGPLRKLSAALVTGTSPHTGEVRYAMRLDGSTGDLNARVGPPLTVRATGAKTCVVCGRSVTKFFGQGFCFPCLRDAPEASECIVRPELCRAHLGEGRDPAWEREHHDQEHIVYLSWTGGVKVGVTRSTQVPVRWIDQGAVLGRAAMQNFEMLGFPTIKHEEWKYSNVSNLVKQAFDFNVKTEFGENELATLSIPNLEGNVLYFINGIYNAELSNIVSPESQLQILNFGQAVKENPTLLETYFAQYANYQNEAFTALNTAFAHDGVVINVLRGK